MVNCATTGLEAYVPSEANPWDAARIQHLYRRIGLGARLSEIDRAVEDGVATTVPRLLNEEAARPPLPEPEWAYWDYDAVMAAGYEPFELFADFMKSYVNDAQEHGIREKFVLFWHNHFVVQYESHSCPSYHYQYWDVLTKSVFGNFKTFVNEITTTPGMLFFLNGFENTKDSPNENYARELFELFTLGENNGYTQEDIEEASRALTGYNGWTSYCGGVDYAPWGYDNTPKTVFGRTGNFNSNSLIEVLFEERGDLIATYICRKIYAFFVNPSVNEEIVAGLAQTFKSSGWELMPVYQQLFASAHFFDDKHYGVQVKTPLELMTGFLRQGQFGDFEERLNWSYWVMANMGQQLGQPPDVFGWKNNRSWIDSNRLTLRWEALDGFAWAVYNANNSTLIDWARDLTGNSRDPEVIARAIIDFFIPKGLLQEEAYELATDVLKWDVPVNYYENGDWSLDWPTAPWQMVVILRHVGRTPEFQLN